MEASENLKRFFLEKVIWKEIKQIRVKGVNKQFKEKFYLKEVKARFQNHKEDEYIFLQ